MWGAVRQHCSKRMLRDLGQRNAYWKQFEGKTQEISSSINNSFLTSQGEEKGVFSYDRVVQLIVGYYRSEGLVPLT